MPEVDVVEEPVSVFARESGRQGPQCGDGMANLDGVDLAEIFKQRARVMRTVPLLLKGASPRRNAGGSRRSAMRQRQE